MEDRRVAILADVSNLYYCIGHHFPGRKLSYKKLMGECKQYGSIVQATAYAAQLDNQAVRFFECLEAYGFDVRIKVPKQYGTGDNIRRKADHDVTIAIDMVRQSERVDTMIMCSADGDMVDAVTYVKNKGCRVIVMGCGISSDLKVVADKWIEIGPALLGDANEEKRNDAAGPAK